MKVEFLQEILEELWRANALPGGISIDVVNNEVILKTDCMVCQETKHIVQFDENLIKNQS